ncbi:GNAT family N-acetyltransferase [Photobacterium japonica]|uniref:tRNA(Met) cytidine acetyltransferase TmcA n=1 Tax=Photobacterium japonica TaxID=2910235 RepID=UPI003D0ED423
MDGLNEFWQALASSAKQAHCRYLVVAQGSEVWCATVAQSGIPQYRVPLWCGPMADPALFDAMGCALPIVPFKQARQWLGRECDCVIINGHHTFDAEAFGALSGTVMGGGVALLLLPEGWGSASDARFHQRLASLFSAPGVFVIREYAPLPVPPSSSSGVVEAALASTGQDLDDAYGAMTACQAEAIQAIRRVVTGHRKRPLVLTADRGRGKSSALGLAAASLLAERKLDIAVTAPSYAAVETLFRHVATVFDQPFSQQKKLTVGNGSLQFVAPDALLASPASFDCVMVDEAAAIPAPLLAQLLGRFNRLVFASTVHGYEGTGRGFAVKFRQLLDSTMPQWRELTLQQPIRWAKEDPLEHWVFQALLLNTTLTDCPFTPDTALSTRRVPADEWLHNENLLGQLFGLLVNAHYQTSPTDLVALLDDPALHTFVTMADNQVVGCCLVMAEGGLAPDLVEAIQRGERRTKGHLLAQSLAAQVGIGDAAEQRAGRILRIAIHPQWQQRGVGSALLSDVAQWAETCWDYLGTSFGYLPELLGFWLRNGYHPARLGFTRDATSGYPSLLCVKPISTASQCWWPQAQALFTAGLACHWYDGYVQLSAHEALPLYRYAMTQQPVAAGLPINLLNQQLALFCQGGLGIESALPALQQWFSNTLLPLSDDHEDGLALLFAKLIQRQSWPRVVADFGFTGRKQAEQAVRAVVQRHYVSP